MSCTEPEYRYQTLRFLQGYESPDGPPRRTENVPGETSGTGKGRFQKAHPGSYGIVQDLGVSGSDTGIHISCNVSPWLLDCDHPQALVSTLNVSTKSGAALILNGGKVEVWVGLGDKVQQLRTEYAPARRRWFNLDLSLDNSGLSLRCKPLARFTEPAADPYSLDTTLNGTLHLEPAELLIAAGFHDTDAQHKLAIHHLNGRIDSVSVDAIGDHPRVLAHLDFSIGISSDSISDSSGVRGSLVNCPSRAMKGPNWDGTEVDWTKATHGYGAIHFHEDDLDDALWETDFTIKVPETARSGVYAVEVQGTENPVKDNVVFYVRPTKDSTAKVR